MDSNTIVTINPGLAPSLKSRIGNDSIAAKVNNSLLPVIPPTTDIVTSQTLISQSAGLNIQTRSPLSKAELLLLPPAYAKDTVYISALELLKGSEITIDVYLINKLTESKGADPAYISGLIELKKTGIKVDGEYGYLIDRLTLDRGRDPAYIAALTEFQKAGIKVDGYLIDRLTPEKGKDQSYTSTLIVLHHSDLKVDGYLVDQLTPEKAKDLTHLDALKEYQKVIGTGFLINKLAQDCAGDTVYILALTELKKAGVQVAVDMINSLTLDKGRDRAYIAALIKLQKAGIKIDAGLIENLTREKGDNPDYISSLLSLKKAGINVDNCVIYNLTAGLGKDGDYISSLVKLQNAGVHVDHLLISRLSPDKARGLEYIDSLLTLHKAGLTVDWNLLTKLTLDKAIDPAYISCLAKNKGEFITTDKAYISSKYNVNYQGIIDAAKIQDMIALYQQALVSPISKKIVSDDLKHMALIYIEKMNVQHESSPAVRLKAVAGMNAGELFQTIVAGEEEAYTSTFNLLFKQLIRQCKAENLDGMTLLKNTDPDGSFYPVFFMMAANYGRLKEFLDIFSVVDKVNILKDFVDRLSTSPDRLKHAIAITETLTYEKDMEIRKVIEDQLISKMDNLGLDPEIKKVYAIIGSVYCTNIEPQGHKDEFKELRKMHRVEPKETLKVPVDKDNEIIEQMYFYDDKDGKSSFDNFKATFIDWKFEDAGTYVILSKQQNGKTVKIYANKPGNEEGSEEINNLLKQNNKHVSIVVHRGHSYHAYKTLDQISPDALLVYLGSCGGDRNLSTVYSKSKHAQIIATKGTGSYEINDPMLQAINEGLFQAEINWRELGIAVMSKLKKQEVDEDRAGMYILPYQNVGMDIIDLMNK